MKKRLLAIILAVVMAMSLLPVSAFAKEDKDKGYDHIDVKVDGEYSISVDGTPYKVKGTIDKTRLTVKIGETQYSLAKATTQSENGQYEYHLGGLSNFKEKVVYKTDTYVPTNVTVSFRMYFNEDDVPDALKSILRSVSNNGVTKYYVDVTDYQYTGVNECTGGNGMRSDGKTGNPSGLDLYINAVGMGVAVTKGKLAIQKIVINEQGEEISDSQKFSYTLEINNDDGTKTSVKFTKDDASGTYTYAETGTVATVEVQAGKTVTLEGLPAGLYTVTELQQAGYIVTDADGSAGEDANYSYDFTIEDKDDSDIPTAVFTNMKLENNAAISIAKTSTGLPADSTYRNPQITISKQNDDGTWASVWSGTITANGNRVYPTVLLSAGTYKVEETGTDVENYRCSATLSANIGESAQTVNGMQFTIDSQSVGQRIDLTVNNSYELLPSTGSLTISKVYADDSAYNVESKQFTMRITGAANEDYTDVSGAEFVNGVATVTVTAETPVTISGLPLGTYTVAEINADIDNYKLETSYSSTNGQVTVDADQNNAAAITVTNKYTAKTPASLTISGSKTIAGTGAPANTTFEFALKQGDDTLKTASTTGAGTFTFDAISLSAIGTYTYTVSEKNGGSANWDYDDTVYTVTVTVTNDPADSTKLKVSSITYTVNGVAKDAIVFSNTFTPDNGSLTITKVDSKDANIKLSGATFTLTPVAPTAGTSLTATSDTNGVATFSSIPLGTYTLTETTAPNGYLDSSDVYSVSVTAVNGVTTTTVTKGGETDSDGAITVGNVQKMVNTTIAKAADKTVYAPGDTVTYTIRLTNTGNSADKVTVVDTLPTELKACASNISEGGTYDAATGTITWTNVSVGAQVGVTAGTTTLTYQVNIPTDIALKSYTNTAVIQGQSGDGKTATATITVEATDLMTPVKTVNTTTVAPNGELTYTITVKNEGNKAATVTITDAIPDGLTLVEGSIVGGGQLGPDGKTITWSNVTVPAATVENETLTPGDVSVSFKATVPADVENGHKYTNTAVVTEGEKKLTTDPVETVVDNLSATISGTKNVAQGGNVSVPADAEFTFSLTLVKINGNAVENGYTDTVTSGKGDFSFQPIKYTEAGTYVYEVKETAGSAANWTYDDTTYTVTVIVSRDANDGKLVASAPVYSVGDTNADKITFTNTYTKNATIPVKPPKPPVLNTEDHYGYIVGYPDGTVRPEGTITRAEVATIFFRLLTDESRSEYWSQTCSYSDVAASDWFNNAVCTLSNAGLITGYEDGTFRPNSTITRAEFATIASRFFEYADKTYENPFSDVDEGAWYYNYVMAASDMGLINGYPDGTFGPQKSITRAEAVTIVNRTLDRHPDEDHLLDDMIIWPDNQKSDWYYADVQEATNSHEYQMSTSSSGKYEIWTQILPIRDWAAYEKAWSDANSASGGEVMP